MEKYSDSELLSRIYIAAPCPVSWDDMDGNDRTRHCQQCHLNVYNIQELSNTEVADLVRTTEGRLCGRLFRRSDGTVITNNCPKGFQFIKRLCKIAVSLLVASLVCLGLVNEVQAQELVGAPVDPRYGASGMISVYDSPMEELFGHPLLFPFVLSSIMFLWGLAIKYRAKLVFTSLLIGILMLTAGMMFVHY